MARIAPLGRLIRYLTVVSCGRSAGVARFGLILGRGATAGELAGIFGLATVSFGALAGGGIALSGRETAVR